MTEVLEQRIEELEGRFAFLDDAVQELNGVVTAQQRLIERMETELRGLREAFQSEVRRSPGDVPEPPPPHY